MPGTRCDGCNCMHEGLKGIDCCPIVQQAKVKAVESGEGVSNDRKYLDFSSQVAVDLLGTGAKQKHKNFNKGYRAHSEKSQGQNPTEISLTGANSEFSHSTEDQADSTDDMTYGSIREHSRLGEESGDPSLLNIDIRGGLLEVLEYETIFPIVGPSIYYADRGQIGGKLNEDNNDKMLNYLEYLDKRVACGEFTDYNIFKKVLAGVQPDVFRKFLKREPTREEVDYCIQDYCQKMKKQIIETGHISDSDHYKEIDLGQQYVQLRVTAGHLTEEDSEKSEDCYENEGYSNDISARNLFDESRGRRVLVKGRTGSGKTTLVQWLTRKWAIGDVEADFSILFIFNVRDLIALGNREMSLYDLFSNKSLYEIGDAPGFPRQWLKHWSQYVGLIIDGLDEIGSFKNLINRHKKMLSIDQKDTVFVLLSNILRGNLLKESKVIYTTRAFLDLFCLPQENLGIVQILGFTKDAVMQYIQQHHAENAEKIRTVLDNKPALLSACSICFYCVQICSFLSKITAGTDYNIGTYTQLTAFIMLKMISAKDTDSDLAQIEKTGAYLVKLAHLAYDGLFPKQKQNVVPTKMMIFKREDLKKVGLKEGELVMARKDGIIVHTGKKQELFVEGWAEFTHLSFQELIAAGHIIGNHDELERLIKENMITIYDTENMLTLFLFGLAFDDSEILTYFKEHLKCDSDVMKSLIPCFETRTDILITDDLRLHIVQVAYESQSKIVSGAAQNLLFNSSSGGQLIFKNIMLTYLDMSALLYTCTDQNFERVEFCNCNIDEVTISELVQFLDTQHVLKIVNLSGNQFGKQRLNSLCTQHRGTLTELHLNDVSLGDDGVIKLLESLQKNETLENLSLARNGITLHYQEDFPSSCTNMTAIQKGHKKLLQLGLLDLSLGDNAITDQGIENLMENIYFQKNLRNLDLSKNQITETGAKYLITKVSPFEGINLSGNQIDVFCMNCNDLVNLKGNTVGDDRAEVIAESIKFGKKFKVLDLHGMIDYGLYIIAAEIIGSQFVTDIWIEGEVTESQKNQIILDVINQTCTNLKDRCSLNGEKTINETSSGVINLSGLRLRNDVLIQVLKSLTSKQSITSLNLMGQPISDDTAQVLATTIKSLINLQNLNLESTKLTANGVKMVSQALHTCNIFRVLKISKNPLNDKGADEVGKCLKTRKLLTELDIHESGITPGGMCNLMESLQGNQNLECLVLSSNSFDRKGIKALGCLMSSKAISTLKVGKNNLGEEGACSLADALSMCDSLKEFEMDQTFLPNSAWCRIFEALRKHTKIESLSLQRNLLTINEVKSLSILLECLANLSELLLSGTSLGYEGANKIATALEGKHLKTISMQNCKLTCPGIESIAARLHENQDLQTLYLGGNTIGDLGASYISQSLTQHPNIGCLKLQGIDMSEKGVIQLSQALSCADHKNLQVLDLGGNSISDEGALHLGRALEKHNNIEELGIENNNISEIGTECIANALENFSYLKRLCIHGNPIKDEGALIIAAALRKHCHLRILTMDSCRLSDDSARGIAESLLKHKFLLLLYLDGNNISDEGVRLVKKILKPLKMLVPGIVDSKHGSRDVQMHEVSSMKLDAEYDLESRGTEYESIETIKKELSNGRYANRMILSETDVSKEDFIFITHHLWRLKDLHTLNFTGIDVLGIDKCMIELAVALKELRQLQVLTLKSFKVSLPDFVDLTKAVSFIVSLVCLELIEYKLYESDDENTPKSDNENTPKILPGNAANHQEKISEVALVEEAKATKNISHQQERGFPQNTTSNLTDEVALEVSQTKDQHCLSQCLNNISDRAMDAIVDMLGKISQITTLNLSGNQISDNGAEALAQALMLTTQLKHLVLSQNQISDRGAGALAKALINRMELTQLELSQNQISDRGVEAFAKALNQATQLRVLGLSKNQITDKGIGKLAEALQDKGEVAELYLCKNRIGDKGVEYLASTLKFTCYMRLTKLDLSENQLSDKGGKKLALAIEKCTQLHELHLHNNQLSDDGIEALAQSLSSTKDLLELSLNHNQIGDRGVKALASALGCTGQLSALRLTGNRISDTGVEALVEGLKHVVHLRELELSENKITESGAMVLAEVFRNNKRLTKLGLAKNRISDQGAKALVQALTNNTRGTDISCDQNVTDKIGPILSHTATLSHLDLSENLISDSGVEILAQAWEKLFNLYEFQVLDMSSNQISDRGAEALANALKHMTKLTKFNFGKNQISDRGAEALAQAFTHTTQLTELHLYQNQISERGAITLAQALKHMTKLTKFNLEQNQISDKGAEALAKAFTHTTQLKELDLFQNQISDRGAEALAQAFTHTTLLTVLGLAQNHISDRGAKALAQAFKHSTKINELYLQQNQISDRGAAALAQAFIHTKQLTKYQILDRGAEALAQAFTHNTQLEKLGLAENQISDIGAEALAQAFTHTIQLTELDLSQNQISDRGTEALAQAFTHTTQLTVLDLSQNQISDRGAEALAQAFTHTTQLTDLNLSQNQISDRGAEELGQAFTYTILLTNIGLSQNIISDKGIKSWASGFRLKMLDISGNRISDEGATILANLISRSFLLETLLLENNQIADFGVLDIANAINQNAELKKVAIGFNLLTEITLVCFITALSPHRRLTLLSLNKLAITDDGAKLIAESMCNHPQMSELHLGFNQITGIGAKLLIASCPCLERLYLDGNPIGDEGFTLMAEPLKLLTRLRVLGLSNSSLTKASVPILVEVLHSATKLDEAWLGENDFGSFESLIIDGEGKLKKDKLGLMLGLFSQLSCRSDSTEGSVMGGIRCGCVTLRRCVQGVCVTLQHVTARCCMTLCKTLRPQWIWP